MNKPFYVRGLRFSCVRCSECCRIDPGFVFLRKKDTENLVSALKIKYTDFIESYCRWVPGLDGTEQLSLREKANYDCIFWKNGCSVYEARPLQCKTFPFWPSILSSAGSWEAVSCSGIGKGTLHSMKEIELVLARQKTETVIRRNMGARGSIKEPGEI
jgi:Fe-S-cluster containining protein